MTQFACRYPLLTLVACIAGLGLAGCSPEHYRKSADREVYGIIQAKSQAVPGMVSDFTIERTDRDVLADCPRADGPAPADSQDAEGPPEQQAPVLLSLEKALEIAALNSRRYQTEKESVYREILSLTLQRHAFRPLFSGTLSGEYEETNMGESRGVEGSSVFGLSWLLATGARISAALTTSASQFLKGDPQKAASSAFNLTITQPILRGAGIAVTESLTQAERDAIYEIRDFVRFRRTFFVSILSDFYRVLEDAQVVQNERMNLDSLVLLRQRAEAMAQAGEFSEYQVDQVRQQELVADDRLVRAQQSYETSLDDFKITLGLRTETPLVLDSRELARLTEEGTAAIPLPAERILTLALENRLDLQTSRDRVEDARRRVKVAANDLLPGLDLSASLDTDTDGDSSPADFHMDRTDYSVGFELDLPLDMLSERNSYRSALIAADRGQRDYEELRDEIVRAVRSAWRQYDRAQRSYDIQRRSVKLAEVRLDSTRMLLDAGRIEARDVLDAQQALVDAQNDLAGALVDYKAARLELARDMGVLAVGDKGELKESFDAYQ